ncbi:uncharacterized protein LOC128958302 [Oppia nitens]|uniref:uncharacterized protein LOC128958302 n=1 Tax=Oppia nitens TaxID=1686743 RepID=UPI0023DCD3EF|nr:uncharacterized protein LOC128958302 [Oppia nitens]
MSLKDPLLGSDWLASDSTTTTTSGPIGTGIGGHQQPPPSIAHTLNGISTVGDDHKSIGLLTNHSITGSAVVCDNQSTMNNYNHSRDNSNKEQRLMSAIGMSSSDSSTDDIVIPMQKRKVRTRFTRKRRSRSTDSNLSLKSRVALSSCPAICMKFVLILMIFCTIAFTVLFIAKLYDRIDSLQTAINDLSVSGNSVPQEFHSIHSHLQRLDANLSAIKTDVLRAFDSIANLTEEVKLMKQQLSKISDSVEAAPAIRQLPKELQDLQNVVANLGSRLTTNDNEVKTMKDQQNEQKVRTDIIQVDVNAIHTNISDLINAATKNNGNGSANAVKVDQNSRQLTHVSDTVQQLQQFYTQLINWKTETDEKLRTVMSLAQHIHDKLHNQSHVANNGDNNNNSHHQTDQISDKTVNNDKDSDSQTGTHKHVSHKTTISDYHELSEPTNDGHTVSGVNGEPFTATVDAVNQTKPLMA